MLHQTKLAVHELIAIQRAFARGLCRPVGDGEKEDAGECDDHREKRRVLIRVDRMRMSEHLDPDGRTEDSQRHRGDKAERAADYCATRCQSAPVDGKQDDRKVGTGCNRKSQAYDERYILLLERNAEQDREHAENKRRCP